MFCLDLKKQPQLLDANSSCNREAGTKWGSQNGDRHVIVNYKTAL